MGTLVCNGSTLYRRSSKLVRTPITITLQPVDMAYYAVAGTYNNQNFPNTGFIAQDTAANVRQMGYDALLKYNNPTDGRQMWRQVNQAHLPEMVWYQGAFATSAPNIAATYASCEAYVQLAAYKFKTPTGMGGLAKNHATLKFVNGGAVVGYQSAGIQSSRNMLWKNWPGLSDTSWNIQFHACPSLGHPRDIVQNPSQTADLSSRSSGAARGVRDLWGFSGTNRDGAIPTLTTPSSQSLQFGPEPRSMIASYLDDGVWIVPAFNASTTSVSNYRPWFATDENGFWACVSCWGLTLEVEFE